jgi:hypothetical protein
VAGAQEAQPLQKRQPVKPVKGLRNVPWYYR